MYFRPNETIFHGQLDALFHMNQKKIIFGNTSKTLSDSVYEHNQYKVIAHNITIPAGPSGPSAGIFILCSETDVYHTF